MMKKTLLSGILLCFTAGSMQAQESLKGGAPDARLTPSVRGDGNNGSVYSPNLFNGTANITIPVYDYGDKGISLSYNTAGVKVDETSGMVGLHWNLNAGGSITRVVKDVPDEINRYDGTSSIMGGGNVGDYNLGIKGKWAQYFGGNNPTVADHDAARYKDDESDDFIFSVGGFSFTFNIGKDLFVFTHPRTSAKIDILVNGVRVEKMPLTQYSEYLDFTFRIRDAQGNWYYFEKGDVSRRTYPTDDQGGTIELQYISRWVVSKVVQSNGQEIRYQYNNIGIYNTGNTSTDLYKSFTALELNGTPVPDGEIIGTNNQYYSIKTLASISYPNNIKAVFVYRNGSRCDDLTGGASNPVLQEIQVTQGDAGTRYIMDQAYALSNKNGQNLPMETALGACQNITAGYDNYRYHRLVLKGVRIGNMANGNTEPYYTFEYKGLRLPPRFSGSQDYFGYYNGKTVTQNDGMLSIPYHTPRYGGGAAYGVNKDDDALFAVAQLLVKIQNGAGGVTEFTYEGNSGLTNALAMADIALPTDALFLGANANDGLRIKSIRTTDARYPGIYTQQDYTYEGGQRFMPGGYFDYPFRNGSSNTLFNSTFVSPHQFINGSNHGYSSVIVETRNQAGEKLSKRRTNFQNIARSQNKTSYYHLGSKNYFEWPYTDKQYIKDWEIGLPLTITDYDKDNNILSLTTNTYTPTSIITTTGKITNLKLLATSDNGANTTIIASESYKPYTGSSLLTKTETKKYITGSSYITDVVTYGYGAFDNLETITTTNSRGESFVLRNIYNYHISGPAIAGSQPGTLYNMTRDGLEYKVGIERWKKGSSTAADKLFDASITCLQYENNKIQTRKLFTLRSLAPVSYSDYTGSGRYGNILAAYNNAQPGAYFQQVSEVLQSDDKGNPLETKISDQPVYKSMIWDAPAGNKVADVSNARLKDIGFTSFERSIGVSYTGSGNTTNGGFSYDLSGDVPSAEAVSGERAFKLAAPGTTLNNKVTSPPLTPGTTYILTFWVKHTGVVSIAGAGLSSIQPVEIHTLPNGWKQMQATFTPSTGGSIEFTTTQTTYIDEIRLFPKGAQMTNVLYAPMAGPTSSTDAQGRITYYLYDALGRQTAVKDQDGNVISKQERHVAP